MILPFDETLGEARQYDPSGQYLRDVVVLINGWWQSTALCTRCNADGIKSELNAKGWVVDQVTNETTSWVPGLYGGAMYRIYAIVARNYSDAQIEQQIIKDLAGFFNVAGVTFITQPYGGLSTSSGGSSAASNYQSKLPDAKSSSAGSADEFLKNFGKSLGISAPFAILGGAVLLALLLRR